ncbi:cupin domain-containing protein [Primorskyibacter sp. 2E107]|uniref:cupin domain-containing protein n=1 Tax=Primorskyibacter sp. 2E107 TaxID=3403458 RepID=UPI003AF5ABAD
MSQTHAYVFPPNAGMPNNPVLPVLLQTAAFVPESAQATCARMERNGWAGTWVWTVFDFHHYHPDAHEALAVASGTARLLIGGPQGTAFTMAAGDLLILPAGTGHCRLEQDDAFQICGAYPPGQESFTTRRLEDARPEDAGLIAATPLPGSDPIAGANGPLTRFWSAL